MTTKGMLRLAKRIIELASLCDSKSRRLGVDWVLISLSYIDWVSVTIRTWIGFYTLWATLYPRFGFWDAFRLLSDCF